MDNTIRPANGTSLASVDKYLQEQEKTKQIRIMHEIMKPKKENV